MVPNNILDIVVVGDEKSMMFGFWHPEIDHLIGKQKLPT